MLPGVLSAFRCTMLTLAFAMMIASSSQAELTWKQLAVDLRADAKSTVLEARFPFTNTGMVPVDIIGVESSCGCTTVSLEKRHYEPRETGEIVARYTVGTQVGAQQKTVEVQTNDGREPTVLTLNVQVPEVLHIQPTFLQWKHGEPLSDKVITLEMVQNLSVKDISAQSSAANFTTEIKTLVPGRKYALTVRPQSTDQHQFSTLTVRCRFGEDEKIFRAYATVRPVPITE